MKTLSLLEIKHKLKTQDIFRGKTVRELVDHIDQQAARITELEKENAELAQYIAWANGRITELENEVQS